MDKRLYYSVGPLVILLHNSVNTTLGVNAAKKLRQEQYKRVRTTSKVELFVRLLDAIVGLPNELPLPAIDL